MSEGVGDIYDRLVRQEDLKNGTKFERLAGIVFRLLMARETVHDVRLRGSSTVKHQIDVVVGDERRRILVEAKDYEKTIGLGVVRDFRSVVEDLEPDEAFVVSREGFTGPARKFAEAKGIRLATLRAADEQRGDFDNRAMRVSLQINATVPVGALRLSIEPHIDAGPLQPATGPVRTDEVLVRRGARNPQPIGNLVREIGDTESVALGERGTSRGAVRFSEPTHLQFPNGAELRVSALSWEQDWDTFEDEPIVFGHGIAGLVAELIFRTLDGAIDELIDNKRISEWTVAPSGAIVSKRAY